MLLTELKLKNLKRKSTLYRVSDNGGLCIEVGTSGSKLWRWRYYFNGKQQMLALGRYPDVSLAQARSLRDQARALAHTGKHPTREKRANLLRKANEGENTFERVAMRWMEIKAKGLNPKYARQCSERMSQHVFPLIGSLPVSEISIPDVVRVVEKISQRGTIETAKRMKQLIGQVFRYASQRGLCVHNPAADLRDVLPSTPEAHHASISVTDLPQLKRAIDHYKGNPLIVAAMRLLALTFVRTGELIAARWTEIDFDEAQWNIPKERMKMRRPHMVPLSLQSVAILREVHKLTGTQTHVFHSGASKLKHISNGSILMALRRMGFGGRMTGHGFRTLASTVLNERGFNADVIERQLAHEDQDKIRSAYNRAQYVIERRKMMQVYADFLDGIGDHSNVIRRRFGLV